MPSGILILALTPTESPCSQIWQSPRFVAKKRGFEVEIRCHAETSGTVSWLRKQERNDPRPLTEDRGRILKTKNGSIHTLTIRSIQYQDNGIYYCQWNCSETSSVRGCGTELRVMGVCGACPPGMEGSGGGQGHRVLMESSHSIPPQPVSTGEATL